MTHSPECRRAPVPRGARQCAAAANRTGASASITVIWSHALARPQQPHRSGVPDMSVGARQLRKDALLEERAKRCLSRRSAQQVSRHIENSACAAGGQIAGCSAVHREDDPEHLSACTPMRIDP